MYCDISYLKQEINYLDYMQNRQEADVYILATDLVTGSQGWDVQLIYIGQHAFKGKIDTLHFFNEPNATLAIRRENMVNNFKKGLLPFLLDSELKDAISFTVDIGQMGDVDVDTFASDPWNNWVFNIGGNGNFSAEERFSNYQLYGNLNASRVTDDQKFTFYGNYGYEESSFSLTDGELVKGVRSNFEVYTQYVRSFGQHWSVGVVGEMGSSTFGNTDLFARMRPGIEYNIYPFDEVQTRRFTLLYVVGPAYYNYTDSTIYDKLEELLIRQGFELEFSQTQKWGNVYLQLGMEQFLHNLKYFNAYLNPNINIQIFKGLSFNFGAYVSFVSDRINIAKADITDEDILLQIKQLDTDFSYFGYFGLNYRFGSKYNNYVNKRF